MHLPNNLPMPFAVLSPSSDVNSFARNECDETKRKFDRIALAVALADTRSRTSYSRVAGANFRTGDSAIVLSTSDAFVTGLIHRSFSLVQVKFRNNGKRHGHTVCLIALLAKYAVNCR